MSTLSKPELPVSSPSQFEAVRRIVEECPATVATLARCKDDDIESAGKSLIGARRSRIHTFIGTSDYHILGKFSFQPLRCELDGKTSHRD